MAEKLFNKVVIVGPGLIGGSMGLAMKGLGLVGQVVGVGHRQSSMDDALKMGAIDRATLALEDCVADADLVVLCTGVELVPAMAARAIPLMKSNAILTDVGSVKLQITTEIEAMMGDAKSSFLGTHPLAGLEKRGVQAARADLFKGSTCVFTPTEHTTPDAKRRLAALWTALGARVKELDPATHDKLICQISHLPHLIAGALVNAVGDDALDLAATGFRDVTRVASGDPELWAQIFMNNRENVSQGMILLLEQIGRFADALDKGDKEALLRILQDAKKRRDGLTTVKAQG